MESETEQKSHRGIYLLPNAFTTAAMFAGFYAIVAAMSGRYEQAAIAVFIAVILDGIDGRVARMTNTQSAFGAEYDSLSDMVSFGLAPALVMYQWALVHMNTMGPLWAKVGWLAAFFYAACAALRLARFNTKIGVQDKRFFQGLPSPTAAMLLMGMVWMWHDLDFVGRDLRVPALLVTVIAGALMVSSVSFFSFKDIDFRNRVPFIALLAMVVILMLVYLDTPKVLWGAAVLYTLHGPVLALLRWRRKRSRAAHRDTPSGDAGAPPQA